jgi:Cytochrome oxidase assembly protein
VFENGSLVQFNHRILAYASVALGMGLMWKARKANLPRNAHLAAMTTGGLVFGQMTLGIATLLSFVPVPLGVAHQAGALTTLSSALWFLHTLGPKAPSKPVAAGSTVAAGCLMALASSTASTEKKQQIEYVPGTVQTSVVDKFVTSCNQQYDGTDY